MILALVLLTAIMRAEPIVITRSGSFSLPNAILPSPDVEHPALIVRGDNLTVDFENRPLRGTAETVEPDLRLGLGIVVEGNNVTLRHAKVRGYKVGVLARNRAGLKIVDSDFSYNWKQHLKSTPEREDESDWMSYHQNDHDEWLRENAGAIYLRGCEGAEIRNVRITGGQVGLAMTECNHALVWNNDFSFLSGLGIGMYRCSDNRIMHNKVDWCVRGHSEGVYNRGQDSAGILVYEQSNRNVFAYNSVTHGGDGFFLWAGQTTMDTGQGGCNDNLVYGNDFSHAPTNGIEATFSRNAFVNNKVLECWHGVWGGYSYDTRILGNAFGFNGEAISIEHGQNNTIANNSFWRDNDGIGLWMNQSQDPNWGYPKHRDTRSRDISIINNYFGNIPGTVLRIRATMNVNASNNRFDRYGTLLREDEPNPNLKFENNRLWTEKASEKAAWGQKNSVEVSSQFSVLPATMQPSGLLVGGIDLDRESYLKRFDVTWNPYPTADNPRKEVEALAPQPLKGGKDPFLKPTDLRGRRFIIIDEWGPYDFKRPLLTPSSASKPSAPTEAQPFEILGPRGSWHVVSVKGTTLSKNGGEVPGTVEVSLPASGAGSIDIELEYSGGATTDYRGIVSSGKVRFGYQRFRAPIDWDVKFFAWRNSENSADPHAAPKDIASVYRGQPLKELRTMELDMAGGALAPGLPDNHYATLAEGTFTVPPGRYVLELTTDDGARVWVDGRPVISDAWKYQGPTAYTADLNLDARLHRIRVEHFQIDGYAALKVKLRPRR